MFGLVLNLVISLNSAPHHHSYFNYLSGGSHRIPPRMLGSNMDWGRDLFTLRDWCKKHPDFPIDGIAYSSSEILLKPSTLGLTESLPPSDPFEVLIPSTDEFQEAKHKRYAIFIDELFADHGLYKNYIYLEPRCILGGTVYIFEIPPAIPQRNRMPSQRKD